MSTEMNNLPQTIRWENGCLFLLDQTRLPLEVVYEQQETVEQVRDSIRQLKVRGAPAIGVAGAYGLVVAVREQTDLCRDRFMEYLEHRAAYLADARPTAVNLSWALQRLLETARKDDASDARDLIARLEREATRIHDEDRELCRRIGESGLPLVQKGMGILTHCNAGSLATSQFGTALAPMYLAHERGVPFRVYCDETRPLLQGARLTSWELKQCGIDVTLICDNSAAHLMSQGLVNMVLVGTDRVAANGDVANKIGTLGVAILARHFEIPFFVACPYSTIDFQTADGSSIPIEERGEQEVTHFGSQRTAPQGIETRNPAFDVTPNALVSGLITERGIVRAPYDTNLKQRFSED